MRANLKAYVDSVHSAISDELAEVSKNLSQLDEVWSGDAATAFRSNRDKMQGTLSQLLGAGPGEGSLGQIPAASAAD